MWYNETTWYNKKKLAQSKESNGKSSPKEYHDDSDNKLVF